MIGIYHDEFLDYLRDHLGDYRKVTSKNIIVPCPWCEFQQTKDHYHLYIALEIPIFHCFHCEKGGTLRKLIKQIQGTDISDTFIDKQKITEYTEIKQALKEKDDIIKIKVPPLNKDKFLQKEMYIRKRLKFANLPTESIKGLIYNITEFIDTNDVPVNETLFRIKDYLQTNFVGFITEHNCTVLFRNIDDNQSMRFFKLKLDDSYFVDYYRIIGGNPNSNKIVLAEGIFDIFAEQIYDSLQIKNDVKLYASVLSSNYTNLIRSIVYYEQIFRPEVIILSDKGIDLEPYRKLYYYNQHIIESLSLYYNLAGKDFNDVPVEPRRISLDKGAKKYVGYSKRKIKRNF